MPGASQLHIHQPPSEVVFSSGFRIWPAADVIAGYLIGRGLVSGARILEIGSGTGTLGLACAAAGAKRVVLTDRTMDDAQPSRRYFDLLEKNVSVNSQAMAGAQVIIDELDFQKEALVEKVLRNHGPFDLVIGCEIMYDPTTHADLAKTLAMIRKSQDLGTMQTFLSEFQRQTPESLAKELGKVGLDLLEVHSEGDGHGKVGVFEIAEADL